MPKTKTKPALRERKQAAQAVEREHAAAARSLAAEKERLLARLINFDFDDPGEHRRFDEEWDAILDAELVNDAVEIGVKAKVLERFLRHHGRRERRELPRSAVRDATDPWDAAADIVERARLIRTLLPGDPSPDEPDEMRRREAIYFLEGLLFDLGRRSVADRDPSVVASALAATEAAMAIAKDTERRVSAGEQIAHVLARVPRARLGAIAEAAKAALDGARERAVPIFGDDAPLPAELAPKVRLEASMLAPELARIPLAAWEAAVAAYANAEPRRRGGNQRKAPTSPSPFEVLFDLLRVHGLTGASNARALSTTIKEAPRRRARPSRAKS